MSNESDPRSIVEAYGETPPDVHVTTLEDVVQPTNRRDRPLPCLEIQTLRGVFDFSFEEKRR